VRHTPNFFPPPCLNGGCEENNVIGRSCRSRRSASACRRSSTRSKCLSIHGAQSRTNQNQVVNIMRRLRLIIWPRSKRRRAAALSRSRGTKAFIPRSANAIALWSAPVLWRFPGVTQKRRPLKWKPMLATTHTTRYRLPHHPHKRLSIIGAQSRTDQNQLRNCLVGGTGLRPVVSGVPPETVAQRITGTRTANHPMQSPPEIRRDAEFGQARGLFHPNSYHRTTSCALIRTNHKRAKKAHFPSGTNPNRPRRIQRPIPLCLCGKSNPDSRLPSIIVVPINHQKMPGIQASPAKSSIKKIPKPTTGGTSQCCRSSACPCRAATMLSFVHPPLVNRKSPARP
jgi:hypothetical protein